MVSRLKADQTDPENCVKFWVKFAINLIFIGASVNVPDKSGQLPLHLSLSTSNAECAE